MSELLKKDITIRIVSILFALALWFVVNPVVPVELTVPLTVVNENSLKDRGLELKNRNFNRTIKIRVRGREEKVSRVNENDFEAVLDFSKVRSVLDNKIEIDGPLYKGKIDGLQIETVWPKIIDIELESVISKEFPIELEPPTGTPKAGYVITSIVVNPEKILLREVESLIKQVGKIKVAVDVSDIDRSKVVTESCRVYDKSGREILRLSRSSNVDINIEVAKEVPVTVVAKDKLSPDYVGGIGKITPDRVLITGPYEIMQKITELKTEPVSISDLNATTDIKASIVLPQGVKLVDSTKDIMVNVQVEPLIEKEIAIGNADIALVNMDEALEYIVVTQSLNVRIKGLSQIVDVLNKITLNPEANMAGLGEGTYKLPLNLNIPNGVRALENYEIEVLVQKKIVEPPPEGEFIGT